MLCSTVSEIFQEAELPSTVWQEQDFLELFDVNIRAGP